MIPQKKNDSVNSLFEFRLVKLFYLLCFLFPIDSSHEAFYPYCCVDIYCMHFLGCKYTFSHHEFNPCHSIVCENPFASQLVCCTKLNSNLIFHLRMMYWASLSGRTEVTIMRQIKIKSCMLVLLLWQL